MSRYNMPHTETINGENIDSLRRILIGRRIIKAKKKTLILDTGTKLRILPNDGCGWCPDGNYWIEYLNHFDNAITNVEVTQEDIPRGDGDEIIKVFVFSDSNIKDSVIAVRGDEGSGYYGRGFEIRVQNPKRSPKKGETHETLRN